MCPPCHVFAYIWANTRTSALKNLTFLSYEYGKGQYTFYPVDLSRLSEIPKFHKGGPLRTGQTPL